MGQLNLALLGTPEFRRNGHPVNFPTRKALALLIYLAVERRAVPRERITALLWPESNSELGRASLRKALTYLRQALDPNNSEAYLHAERDSLHLDPNSSIEADVWALQEAAQATRQPPLSSPSAMASLPSAQVRRLVEPLQRAVALYRGDFLAGFSLSDAPEFDDWASLQREFWHRQVGLVFDRLSQAQFESGQLTNAIDTTTRWVAHDALNETAYRRLMQLHFANGDRAAALQVHAACQAVLARELSVEPSAETEALAKRLRLDRGARGPSLPVSAPVSHVPSLAESPLVGRAFEHLQLVTAYRAAHQGELQIITLEGEPGIGKTRLAQEFLAWAAAQGAEIWSGRAFEASGRLPYQPIVEALRSIFKPQPSTFDVLSPIWLAELSRLLPELTDHLPNLPSPLPAHEAEARLRLFEAVARLGEAITQAGPVVLFIDDLQWADAASLEVLQYVARRWHAARLPVLLLFTLRTEDLTASPDLTGWLSALRRDASVTRLTLSTLSFEDTQQLVQALSESIPTAPDKMPVNLDLLSHQLFAETSGQPFFIVQTVRSLAERGLWQRDESGEWRVQLDREIPGTIRDLIQSRLARLSLPAQIFCAGGAVLGDGFQFGSLRRLTGLSEQESLPALEELLARGLWREVASANDLPGSPVYFFTHDRIREVAYAQLSQTRRQVLHRAALEALSANDAPGQGGTAPAQLARHALLANLPALAFHFSLEAGEAAMRIFALSDAINHFEQAQRLWLSGDLARDPDLRDQIFFLYQQLGRAYELANRLEQAHQVYTALLSLARQKGDAILECLALNRLATAKAQTYVELDAALAMLQEALQVAEASGNRAGLAETEWNLAQLYYYQARLRTALTHAERALSLARELGQNTLIARTLNILAYLRTNLGQWSEAEVDTVEAQALFAALSDQAMVADSLCLIAEAKLGLGQADAAINAAQVGMAIAQEIQNPWGQANGAFHLALGMLESGDYGSALTYARQAVSLVRTHNLSVLLSVVHLVLGKVYRALGQVELARQTDLEPEQFNIPAVLRTFRSPTASALCADCAMSGAWAEAYAWARKALETRDTSLDFHAGLTFWYEVEALLHAGEMDLAAAEVRRFGERIGQNPRYRLPYLRALAALELAQEEKFGINVAIAHLKEAAILAEEIGLPGEQWSILAALGKLYRAGGDEAKAQETLAHAATIVHALAATIDDESLRAGFLQWASLTTDNTAGNPS